MGKETLLPRSSLQDRKKKQQTQQRRRSKRRKKNKKNKNKDLRDSLILRGIDAVLGTCVASTSCLHEKTARSRFEDLFVHRQALRNNPASPPATLESPKRNAVAHKMSKHV
jgi:mannitol-specific phosphotransferase system IIBC component